MDQKKIVCFGEVLWDVFPTGKKLGGAPFNVAAHTAQHGDKSSIISAVGSDELGKEILNEIALKRVSSKFVQIDQEHETGVVKVELDEKGIPSYDIKKPVAWDFISFDMDMIKSVQQCNAFVFGSLASRSEKSRKSLITMLSHAKLKICDLNIRQNYYSKSLIRELLFHCNILKINDDEATLLGELFDINQNDFYKHLSSLFNISMIIQTLGADGAEAWKNDHLYKSPGYKVRVLDTVGSGDAFLSSFIHHYLDDEPIDICISRACQLGAFVATQHGAVPGYESKKIYEYEKTTKSN